jgi:hypothetical protein
VFATPFAFLIDGHGVIASKGIVGSKAHLGYVLSGAGPAAHGNKAVTTNAASLDDSEREAATRASSSSPSQVEVQRV